MVDPEELSPRLVRSRRAWRCPPLQDTQIDIRPTIALSPRLLLRRSPAVIAAALARSTSRIDMFAHCRQYMRDGIRRRRPTTQTAVSMSGTQMICVFFRVVPRPQATEASGATASSELWVSVHVAEISSNRYTIYLRVPLTLTVSSQFPAASV